MFKWNDVVREKMSQILGYTTMLECGFVCIFFVREDYGDMYVVYMTRKRLAISRKFSRERLGD